MEKVDNIPVKLPSGIVIAEIERPAGVTADSITVQECFAMVAKKLNLKAIQSIAGRGVSEKPDRTP